MRGWALACMAASRLWVPCSTAAETTALWLFDEPCGSYPSSVLDSASDHDYPLVLGQGGRLVPGKFGNALATSGRAPIQYPAGDTEFGLKRPWHIFSRAGGQMFWHNSGFAALMTERGKHLRKEVGFVSPVDTRLNLGGFDWTVEFWYRTGEAVGKKGIVFELGLLPESETKETTSLSIAPDSSSFVLKNTPSRTKLVIPSGSTALKSKANKWHHFAFVFSARDHQLKHYVDGQLQPLPEKQHLKSLPTRTPSYFSLGRNGDWQQPLSGALDELRFSVGQVYLDSFRPPETFAVRRSDLMLKAGPPLLFEEATTSLEPIHLENRKHLFIDDSLLSDIDDAEFVVNPPRRAELVIGDIQGARFANTLPS